MTERGVQPEMAQPANQSWQQRWKARYTIRRAYPPFRQALLWIRDIGLVLDATLCIGIALWAPPTVLTDHPALQAYVAFMSNYFGAIHRLSVGALYPEVSQLVFAVGWGVAIVPFVAALLNTVIYVLLLNYEKSKETVASNLDTLVKKEFGSIATAMEVISAPFLLCAVILAALGDLGVMGSQWGWVNGIGMTKAHVSGRLVFLDLFFMHLYTSRLGLGLVSSVIIYVGVSLYSGFFWGIVFLFIPVWSRRMWHRITKSVD